MSTTAVPPLAVSPKVDAQGQFDVADAEEFPTHRCVTVQLTDGLDGAHRVISMLRTRRYAVRDLRVSICEGVVVSEVRCTVVSTAADIALLLERLRRIPVVVAADDT
jgi:hypothetical protein